MEPRSKQNNEEIDLIDLFNKVWSQKKLLLRTFLGTLVFGLFLTFTLPVEYNSSIILLPETSGGVSSSGSSILQSLGGYISSSGSVDGSLRTELYPEYLLSTPFILSVMQEQVFFSELDTAVTLFDYFSKIKRKPFIDYLKRYTIGLPNLILTIPDRISRKPINVLRHEEKVDSSTNNSSRIYKLTSRELLIKSQIKERITSEFNSDGTITISVKMPDPYASAQLTQYSYELLTEFIIQYRTEKYRENLEFITIQYNDARNKFYIAQERLARFRDQNFNIISARIQTEQSKLETEYQLAAELYIAMAKQLEQAKIKLQEEKPVFKILEPVQVPLTKSEPNRKLILIIAIFLGFVLGTGLIFLKIFYLRIKEAYAENKLVNE